MHIEVVSTESVLFSGPMTFVSLPGSEGSLGVFPGHTPLLTRLKEGFVCIKHDAQETQVYVSGGYVQVMPGRVTVLADTAVRTDHLDAERARAACGRAGPLTRQLGQPNYAEVHAELIESIAHLGRSKKHW